MITKIKAIIDSMGLPFRYGNPSQINYYLNNVDYAAAPDGVAAYCYLLTDSEYVNGKERATIAVFFSKLIPFDFNGSEAVSVTDDCKAKAKEFLHQVAIGNSLTYQDARFQYGYNDFAENVAWCAVRAYFEDMVPDCMPLPDYKPSEIVINTDWITYEHVDGKLLITQAILTDGSVPMQKDYFSVNWSTTVQPSILDIYPFIGENLPDGYEMFNGKVCYIIMLESQDMQQVSFSETKLIHGVVSNRIVINII